MRFLNEEFKISKEATVVSEKKSNAWMIKKSEMHRPSARCRTRTLALRDNK